MTGSWEGRGNQYIQLVNILYCKLLTNGKQITFRIVSIYLYIWGFNVAFITVQVISQRVVLWEEETSIYTWSRFCPVNCRPSLSNYHFSHRPHKVRGLNHPTSEVGGKCVTTAPLWPLHIVSKMM